MLSVEEAVRLPGFSFISFIPTVMMQINSSSDVQFLFYFMAVLLLSCLFKKMHLLLNVLRQAVLC